MQVIRILTEGDQFFGLLCLDLSSPGDPGGALSPLTANVIYATGGPAGIYADSSYPSRSSAPRESPLKQGSGKKPDRWQYWLASLSPRWNVSGTYMQVLPRFISTDPDGRNEREFLQDYFPMKRSAVQDLFERL